MRDPEPGGGELLEDGDCHSLSSDQSDSGCHGDGISSSLGLIRISEQDTISDESGYSEEPIAGRAKEVTVVTVNLLVLVWLKLKENRAVNEPSQRFTMPRKAPIMAFFFAESAYVHFRN